MNADPALMKRKAEAKGAVGKWKLDCQELLSGAEDLRG